jgi:serine/threonine-protein kinase
MAVVYKAKRQGPAGFEKTVVVKAMLPGLINKKDLVDLFRAEARLSAQLSHPNIVQVHDFGVSDNVPYLVMEYLDGRNLTQMRGPLVPVSQGRMPVGAALAIVRDVCLALGYAHEFTDSDGQRRQIIHRDVSPSNVMVCRDGIVKLLDFGVAKVAGQFDCDITQSFRGKYAYMAPEQVNRQPIDRRVDVFACGIVLHEMLTGKRLFAAPSELETLERVSAAQVVAPSVDNPEVPRALDAIVKRALSRDPNQRFGSGQEMAEALEQLEAQMFSRRKLAKFLVELFPDAWTVTCDVCGKQAPPGRECPECGTAAPLDASESDGELPEQPLDGLPHLPSEPLPLPPPPAPRHKKRLELVRTPVEQYSAPTAKEALAPIASQPAPARDPGSFEPMPASGSVPTKVDINPLGLGEAETAVDVKPSAGPGPRLYVVRPEDDSSRMGLTPPPRTAAAPAAPLKAAGVINPGSLIPPPIPGFRLQGPMPRSASATPPPRPQIPPAAPPVVAAPPPPVAQLEPQFSPPAPAPMLAPKTFSPQPVTLPMVQRAGITEETPKLSPPSHFGRNLAIVLIMAGFAAILAMTQMTRSRPAPIEAVPSAAPVSAPAPVVTPMPPAPPAPVIPTPAPAAKAPPAAPKAEVEADDEPARPERKSVRRRGHRRERAEPAPAEPTSTVKEGRIVDPFAGAE